jgi:lipoprotein-anchoring transpeptidase ErfK/SrfK
MLALTLWLPTLAFAASGGVPDPLPETPAEVRAQDEARLTDLGFLAEAGSDEAYTQAVKEFQRYLNRLSETPEAGLPSAAPEVPEKPEGSAGALSIKPLTTYSDIDAIQAFKAYAVVNNEGDLDGDDEAEDGYADAPEPDDAGSSDPGTGALNDAQRARLYGPGLPAYRQSLKEGDDGSEVRRVQRRLISLKYTDHAADGIYDAKTAATLTLFQQASDFDATGEADRATQQALFSADAVASDLPLYEYLLKIDTEKQTVTAFAWEDGEYTKVARKMVCSTGLDDTPTPAGTYKATGPVARWCYFPSYGCWAQYAFRIQGGVLFHSVLYQQAKESTLIKGSVKKLGHKSSHGCVRLSVQDAKWIFDHCTAGTTVIVE